MRFLHVHGDTAVLAERVSHRPGHFFPATLLESQLAALEPLAADEDGVVIDVALPVEAQVAAALDGLGLRLTVRPAACRGRAIRLDGGP